MSTWVVLHAHPDDEASSTGGAIAAASDAGHRVVLVVATLGDQGEAPADLPPGRSLAELRAEELARSADVLGIARIVQLGYPDSGMAGSRPVIESAPFAEVDVETAARRVAAVLDEERADAVTYYDRRGIYGHPDHVQVHHVGRRAAELTGTPAHQVTASRERFRTAFTAAMDAGLTLPGGIGPADLDSFGLPDAEITTRVDVARFAERKRTALLAHASQTTDIGFAAELPDDLFVTFFGTEFYIRTAGSAPGLLDELAG